MGCGSESGGSAASDDGGEGGASTGASSPDAGTADGSADGGTSGAGDEAAGAAGAHVAGSGPAVPATSGASGDSGAGAAAVGGFPTAGASGDPGAAGAQATAGSGTGSSDGGTGGTGGIGGSSGVGASVPVSGTAGEAAGAGNVATAGGTGGLGNAGAAGSVGGAGTSGTAGGGGVPQAGSGGEAGAGNQPPVACVNESDCIPLGMRCDPVTGLCARCLFDTDCPGDDHCYQGECHDSYYCSETEHCESLAATPHCNRVARRCAECTENEHCAYDEHCVQGHCIPYTYCVNSLDCPPGQVCDVPNSSCHECVVDADCGAEEVCANHACHLACASDLTCVPHGLLCNGTYCAECLQHADCAPLTHCSGGQCVLDVCEAGTTFCDNGDQYLYGVHECDADGADSLLVDFCGHSGATCVRDGANAVCVPWVCTPDDVACNDAEDGLETCSTDGLAIIATEPCDPGLECFLSACVDLACDPGSRFCSDDETEALRCSAFGTHIEVMDTCEPDEHCALDPDLFFPACLPDVCTGGAPVCVDEWTAICTPSGSGPGDPITDCPQSGLICLAGECVALGVELVGGSSSGWAYDGAGLVGNWFDVANARTLVEIEAELDFTDTRDLTFVVYEQATGMNMDKVLEIPLPGVVGQGRGFYSSGPISFALLANTYYGLAVHWNDTSEDLTYLYESSSTEPTSFGELGGRIGASGDIPESLTRQGGTTSHYSQRLTTAPPQ